MGDTTPRLSPAQPGWVLDPLTYTVTIGAQSIQLTPLEFRVLHYLMTHSGAIPYQELLQNVWGRAVSDGENTVAVYIRHLRRKLEPDPTAPRHILNVRRHGYRFQP
jgi:DNA-binding response OmpR family regulator